MFLVFTVNIGFFREFWKIVAEKCKRNCKWYISGSVRRNRWSTEFVSCKVVISNFFVSFTDQFIKFRYFSWLRLSIRFYLSHPAFFNTADMFYFSVVLAKIHSCYISNSKTTWYFMFFHKNSRINLKFLISCQIRTSNFLFV